MKVIVIQRLDKIMAESNIFLLRRIYNLFSQIVYIGPVSNNILQQILLSAL